MNKKRLVKVSLNVITIIFIILLIYTAINFKTIKSQISDYMAVGGYFFLFVICFIFESIPTLIGPNYFLFIAELLDFDFYTVLAILILSTTLSGILSYYLGLRARKYVELWIDNDKLKEYDDFVHHHGKWALPLLVISPIPYLPAIMGIFKVKFSFFLFVLTLLRELKYVLFAYMFYYGIKLFGFA